MAVKKGYKQTEVGVIPEDWNVTPLGRIVRSVEYGSSAKSDREGVVPVLRMGNLQNGKIDWNDLVYTSDISEINRYMLRPGDVLFNRTNTIDLVGKTSIFDSKQPAIFAGYLIRINVSPEQLQPRFLNYILNTEFSRKHSAKVLSIAVGQANINGQKLKSYPIPLPPTLAEQEAIAGALSDADAWIESLEQLIAKKRQIKQGAMQELLTGKRRLPGFSGKWVKTTLGELGRWSGGMTPSMANSKYWDGGNFPWVSSGDVKSVKLNDTTQHITTTAIRESATTVMPAGGIIIVNRSGILRRYLPVSLLMRDMAINQDIKGLILKPGLCSEFVLYFILHAGPEILASCMKAGTTVESIELSWLKRFAVQLPNMEEQTAIATVLSDMDTEIEALESKLAKAREIKQGMMQELLTGRIRLIEN
jgi:type I restriction enzyme S subunit